MSLNIFDIVRAGRPERVVVCTDLDPQAFRKHLREEPPAPMRSWAAYEVEQIAAEISEADGRAYLALVAEEGKGVRGFLLATRASRRAG
jgi:hypothetical protein